MIQIEKTKEQQTIYDTSPSHYLEFREKLLLKLIKLPIIVPLMIQ